ncbi:MAG: type I-G CRISPR-associated protein Cas8g1/Csx17 [Nocardioidaceae bacterium]
MNEIQLPGLHPHPLAGYLQALGLLRAVAREPNAGARGWWWGGVFRLSTRLSSDELVDFLVAEYAPSPVVSPWNAGSGFARNGKSRTAEERLDAITATREQRFAPLRRAVGAAESLVHEGQKRGWGGGPLWAADRKIDVITLCRNRLPDDALPWVDACVTLAGDDESYNPLLGTGGNFGRQDLSSTYLQRVLDVIGPDASIDRSRAWAEAALFGREDAPYLRETVGQFDPGRAGGMHSSPWEKGDDTGFVNPWAQILTIEGTLLFASAAVRRLGSLSERSSLPFIVRSSPVGHSTEATDENVKGELWAPEWQRPMSLPELERLFGEGRAEWNDRQAANGLDFVRAVASLGVDRGLTGFTRHVFVERLGQNPLAVTVDRVDVTRREEAWLLRPLDAWLNRIRWSSSLPSGVMGALRQVDAAMYDVAAGGGGAAMGRLVIALGRLHEAVSRSGGLRAQVPPYFPYESSAEGWLRAFYDGSREARLAAGFASLRDTERIGGGFSLRALLTPVAWSGRRFEWADRALMRQALTGPGLPLALGEAHRRRAMPGVVPPAGTDDSDEEQAGVVSAYPRGVPVPLSDVEAFASGVVDDALIADYLRGMLLLDWRGCGFRFDESGGRAPALVPPSLALLLPYFATEPVGYEPTEAIRLRPEDGWVARLLAGDVAAVCADAIRRLRVAGLRPGVGEEAVRRVRATLDGPRLAAGLLLRVPPRHRRGALRAACLPPPESREATPSTPVSADEPTEGGLS